MKIAIISDSHDDIKNIEKFRKIAEKQADAVIHCGDMCTPVSQWFDWKIPIYYTFGNIDGAVYEAMKKAEGTQFHIFKPFGEIELAGKKIAFIHFPKLAHGLSCTKNYDIVFYGHNHIAKKEKVENCWLVNPGELVGWKDKATYAIYDTEKNEVEIKKL